MSHKYDLEKYQKNMLFKRGDWQRIRTEGFPCENREKLADGNRDHRGRYGQKLFGMGGNVLS